MTDQLLNIVVSTWDMYVSAALWLVVGIVAAGLLKAFLPEGLLAKWLGKDGTGSVVKAAFIGAPLPLCSCGVLPAAVGLKKDGASKGATVSFLIATPETGPDSVALSYALLGPFMAAARPVAAVLSAIFAGLLTNTLLRYAPQPAPQAAPAGSIPLTVIDPASVAPTSSGEKTACCSSSCGCESESAPAQDGMVSRLGFGLRYGFSDILDDISLWLALGLVLAGGATALFEPQALSAYGSGFGAMLLMLVIGVPIYVCATASTPIAAGLMALGVSPGTVLVFLLAGPATNLATLGVVGKTLGAKALTGYLVGIAVSSVVAGLLTDWILGVWNIDIQVQMTAAAGAIPETLNEFAAIAFLPFFAWSLMREVKKRLA